MGKRRVIRWSGGASISRTGSPVPVSIRSAVGGAHDMHEGPDPHRGDGQLHDGGDSAPAGAVRPRGAVVPPLTVTIHVSAATPSCRCRLSTTIRSCGPDAPPPRNCDHRP